MATTTTGFGGSGGAEDRVLATAQQIVKSLNTPKEVRQDMLLIFSSFDNRLSSLINGNSNSPDQQDLDRLEAAEKVIHRWDPFTSQEASRHPSSLLDAPDDAAEYYNAVDEILLLLDQISISPSSNSSQVIMDRAENAIQLAMSRLQDELHHVLVGNTVPLDADRLYGSMRRFSLSFASNEGDADEEFESFSEISSERFHDRGVSLGDDFSVDLINPSAVVDLKEITDRMIKSGYEKECLQVYSSIRRDALDECLLILGVDKLSIEEVQKIEWKSLDERMKKWVQGVKIAVRVLLTGEKRLCDDIFSESDDLKEICFNETAKGCVLQLLNFGEAISIGRRSSEKLFRILDMYDSLADVLPDLEFMFSDEFVICEAKGVLSGLGEAAKGTLVEFEKAVQNETSKKPMQGGEIHPLVRYVMNYARLLVDYRETLNFLIECGEEDDECDGLESNDNADARLDTISRRLLMLTGALETNLEEKARLYEDFGMKYIFLMNNILYIVQKVKGSELGKLLGDNWVRKRRGQIRQYANSYLRASWSKALLCLKDDGGIGLSSSNASKAALKERFKGFNACFEEIYRVQTAWKVSDGQLREELRISISEKVIPAYRAFVGRFASQLESGRHAGKYIKYTADDLEKYLVDLFEGLPLVLHNIRRKGT